MKPPASCLFLPLTVCLFIFSCHQPQFVKVGDIQVPRDLIELGKEYNLDYTGILASALNNDSKALAALAGFATRTEDAAVLQHGQVLIKVLSKTGDEFFHQSIQLLNEDSKKALWRALDASSLKSGAQLRKLAPRTLSELMPPPEIRELEGFCYPSEKQPEALLCGTESRYVVIDETNTFISKYRNTLPAAYPGQPAFFKARAYATSFYGSMQLPQLCDSFLVMEEIISIERRNFQNTCIPYEIWAIGTEPFWYASVSSKEGIIEFLAMDEEKIRHFKYSAASITEESDLYTAINETTGDNIRIEVLHKPCSDGMSDRVYNHAVLITINGIKYNGCGLTFSERNSLSGGD